MTLKELLVAVREEGLTKTALENYHSELTNLFAQIHLEMADKEKTEALYFMARKKELQQDKEPTDVAIKRMWNITTDGQRLIELKHFSKAVEKMLSSLKSRIYAIY